MIQQTPEQPTMTSPLQSFKDTVESLVVAFILAFVFITFAVQAFVIPTGSMADTLRGTHYRLTCPTCGYEFNYGFHSRLFNLPDGVVPREPVPIPANQVNLTGAPVCPMCGTYIDTTRPRRVASGDRILVLKFLYQFTDPEPWDVVVFKNPEDPTQSFIKRLIGLPGQTLEIIDGDVYANGKILRKPSYAQNALWIDAYNSDYQPAPDAHARRNESIWDNPFAPPSGSNWSIDHLRRTFSFAGSDSLDLLRFNPDRIRALAAGFVPYNGYEPDHLSIASDLTLECLLTPQDPTAHFSILLGKYNRIYRADVHATGQCSIYDESDQGQLSAKDYQPAAQPTGRLLAQGDLPALPLDEPAPVRFAFVDHALYLHVGDRSVEFLGPDDPAAWGYQPTRPAWPTVALAAHAGPLSLQKVRLARDVNYTNHGGSNQYGRATESHPFTLGQDQFFVLGDNSPQSHDSRFWSVPGKSNFQPYPTGIVPRDYLIGRAFFVYWPSGFPLFPRFPLQLVPNAGQMRFIF